MLDNEFIKEYNIDIDMDYITNHVKLKLADIMAQRISHRLSVDDDPYLKSLQNKFPFLSSSYNIYPANNLPLHIDTNRSCALNIPILNTGDSKTTFYKFIGDPVLRFVPERKYSIVESEVEELFSFSLKKPTLINNTVPHGMTYKGLGTRIILSWSVKPELTFNDVKQLMCVL